MALGASAVHVVESVYLIDLLLVGGLAACGLLRSFIALFYTLVLVFAERGDVKTIMMVSTLILVGKGISWRASQSTMLAFLSSHLEYTIE